MRAAVVLALLGSSALVAAVPGCTAISASAASSSTTKAAVQLAASSKKSTTSKITTTAEAAAKTSSAKASTGTKASTNSKADSTAKTTAKAASSSATAIKTSSGGVSACTFTDAAAASASKTSCSNIVISGVTVPAGTTLDLTGLNSGTTVTFEGTTTFEYEEWDGPLISVSGTSITVTGASGHTIDGNGAEWWDGEGSNGGKTKPKFFYAHSLKQSTISGLNVLNTPVQAFSIDSSTDLILSDITIDNSAGDSEGHNTDAFDVGDSTNVKITGANVKNQDDCLAINSGTNIEFSGATCSGGHGISIGSVGGRSDNTVSGVYISDCTVSDSANGVRIKTVSGATGTVSNVTYTGIILSGITDYGIVIEQDYENGSPTGTPTDGVPITDLTISDITGTVESDATDIYILCASGACSGWTWSSVSVSGGSSSSKCENIPTGASC